MTSRLGLDLRFELRRKGFTHTILGALVLGLVAAFMFGYAKPDFAPCAFLGVLGALSHILRVLLEV